MNQLVSLDAGQVPAWAMSRPSAITEAAAEGITGGFAVLGYRGKAWRIKHQGEETLVATSPGNDPQGRPLPAVPMPYLDVVIVGASKFISKQWYEKKFSEGDDAKPDCFSLDGLRPDPSSPKPQSVDCATCPWNQWGSRVSDSGGKGKACQDSKRIAVVPLGDLTNELYGGPMLLRIPPMSLGALKAYSKMLSRRNAGFEFVATRIGFDTQVAYPKLTFEAIGWLDEEQAKVVVGADGKGGICADDVIDRMLNLTSDSEYSGAPQEAPSALDRGAPAPVFTGTPEHEVKVGTRTVKSRVRVAPHPAPPTTSAPAVATVVAPPTTSAPAVATVAAPAAPLEVAPDDLGATISAFLNNEI